MQQQQPPAWNYGVQHIRVGHMASFQPSSGNYADVEDSNQRLPAKPPIFQAKAFFYDVAYPYWQYPYNAGPYAQAQTPGVIADLRRFGYTGAPLPSQDYNLPTVTAYTPRPY